MPKRICGMNNAVYSLYPWGICILPSNWVDAGKQLRSATDPDCLTQWVKLPTKPASSNPRHLGLAFCSLCTPGRTPFLKIFRYTSSEHPHQLWRLIQDTRVSQIPTRSLEEPHIWVHHSTYKCKTLITFLKKSKNGFKPFLCQVNPLKLLLFFMIYSYPNELMTLSALSQTFIWQVWTLQAATELWWKLLHLTGKRILIHNLYGLYFPESPLTGFKPSSDLDTFPFIRRVAFLMLMKFSNFMHSQ